MIEPAKRKWKMLLLVEMLFTLATIPLCLSYTEAVVTGTLPESMELRALLSATFFTLSISYFLRFLRFKHLGKHPLLCRQKLIFTIAFLISALLPLFFGFTQPIRTVDEISIREKTEVEFYSDVRQLLALVYWAALLISRILSIMRRHTWRNILLNLLLIILILIYGVFSFVTCTIYVGISLQAAISLGAIMAVTFSNIQLDVLQKIVRKTYATEILAGLLLLILSFSYVFAYIEESIPTFIDGIWYSFAIVTTIGFGDITATSIVGRALSMVLGIYGIVVVALITSIIVNFYGEMRKEKDPPDPLDAQENLPAGPEDDSSENHTPSEEG